MISSFKDVKEVLVKQSSVLTRAAQRDQLTDPHDQALARHLLLEVVEYVHFVHDYDDDPLGQDTIRVLDKLTTLSDRNHHNADADYLKALHTGLRAAVKLMKGHDLWLGHNDPDRRGILATFAELGFVIKDRSLDNDPVPPSDGDEPAVS
jgi:hypothetical protein